MNTQITQLVDKWLLVETHDKLINKELEDTPSNNLCLSVIPVAHTYCKAILQLVDANYTLPAMALLRVLAELTLRTCWCLIESDPDVKVSRWLKQSYIERQKFLERIATIRQIPEEDKQYCLNEIKNLASFKDSLSHEPAGRLWDCINELPGAYKDIYRLLYGPFHRGIHPDILVLGDTLKQEKDEMLSLGDFKHIPPQVLWKSCVDTVYQLVVTIQTYYKWDTMSLKSEHLTIGNSLTKSRINEKDA